MSVADSTPLCVDLDGSLIRTDLLHESVFSLLKRAWYRVFLLPLWLLRGKAALKAALLPHVQVDAATLPYREDLLAYLREQQAQGRQLVLATASARPWAEAVAAHLGLFDRVEATENGVNLSGRFKAQRLTELFGAKGFDYVGNSTSDLPVWAQARRAIVVGAGPSLVAAARQVAPVERVFERRALGLAPYLKAIRVHQWAKNVLIFVPLVAAHRAGEWALVLSALCAFVAFSVCASAVYVLNDLLDLPSDRAHPRKRQRPFASGRVPVLHGVAMVPLLLALAVLVSMGAGPYFALVLMAYFVLTLAYSIRLKNQVIVDVILLACLYTTRILAGSAATGIVPSFWLLAESMFAFSSLAAVKRYSEMLVVLKQQQTRAAGRGYSTDDLPVLMSLGMACGMAAVMVLALYVNNPAVTALYPRPEVLWLAPLLMLYWISRIWMKTHRGEMHDDPVVFAAKDWQTLSLALVALVLGALASGLRL